MKFLLYEIDQNGKMQVMPLKSKIYFGAKLLYCGREVSFFRKEVYLIKCLNRANNCVCHISFSEKIFVK